ncbi:beta-lactamase hydrolase domain-containing protein [Acinetobacter schindleri]|jgi:sulfide:quinone oxidoreductase|uniref:beta-lactamase hydrolase domain-containing protein n=1 Tax=Acinetobacter schindleri TaxID=108981 RepID=UPI00209AB02F|nr:sulfur transferase domain-containing protein [Acinetobacter schindleri]MCO8068460.1 sulfur transferase domain-containing protein [Acinetobacter schindleri]
MTKSVLKSVVFAVSLAYTTLCFANSELSRQLTSSVSVTGQMTSDKFQQLMQQGFKSVIVNRPDQEAGNAVTVSHLRSIAEKSQVSVIYQPVISGQITQENIEEFAKYYNELPKPILMVCRSGTRSAALFNQAKSQGLIHE